ncbi:MAG: ATP-grasp domain-containing protein [Prevotella sp.]|nr:ATP-grasp domain-containing protein [Prevotella sp.]
MINKEIYRHKHICLVEDHYNPLAIIRSLGEEGIKPIVLLCSKSPHLVPYSKYVGELHMFSSIQEGLDYMMLHYGAEPLKPFVYNGSDDITLLLDNHYDELKDHFYFTNGQGSMKKYLQKYDITQFAIQCGINIPKEELLKVGEFPTSLKYPVITKAATSAGGGTWKDQSFICEDEKALKEAFSKIKADTILVQEYIRKKNELCIDGISINGGEQVFMPYGCSYYRFPKGSYGNYMYFTPFKDKELTTKITNVLREAQYTGPFCIEFLVGPDDNLYFLEVNFRHSGWGYAFTYGGFNLPVRWASATLDNEIMLDDFKYLDRFDVMQELSDFKDSVLGGAVSLWQWVKDVRQCDCFLYYNKKDPKPFWHVLRKKLLRF